jgi:serine/threonine-protein kinase
MCWGVSLVLKLNEGDEVCRGKYRLIRSLGVGGFAQVFEAENLLTKRRVALKAVDGESAGPEVVARLRREAVVSSRVRHRHIVDVYDLEEEGGGWFLVMEYVRGETLRDALDRGALTPEVALALLCSVMQGLHVMHQHGVVHRDIKPENIYLARQHDSPDLVAKLLDFGICKVAQPDPELPPVTRAGTQAMGTLLYISPEQYADSASVDHRADIYSMGVVL